MTTASTTGPAEYELDKRGAYSAEQVPRCWSRTGPSLWTAMFGLADGNHPTCFYRPQRMRQRRASDDDTMGGGDRETTGGSRIEEPLQDPGGSPGGGPVSDQMKSH